MSHRVEEQAQQFGGSWTQEKLDILAAYLNAYTTALKNQGFMLHYVDAFAGSGGIEIEGNLDGEARRFLAGSTLLALNVDSEPFDRLHFVENSPSNAAELRARIAGHDQGGRAKVYQQDANEFMLKFCKNMRIQDRAVVFLDPFGLQVDWDTVEAIAKTGWCDTWILFPIGTVRRLIPRHGEVSEKHAQTLNRVYGGDSWRNVQYLSPQLDMFKEGQEIESEGGTSELIEAYEMRLKSVFAGVAPNYRILRNSMNTSLYAFMFAAANRRGAPTAVRIADHLLKNI